MTKKSKDKNDHQIPALTFWQAHSLLLKIENGKISPARQTFHHCKEQISVSQKK